MKKFKKGFTLVELVIVIAVIAILSAVLIPTFSGIIERAKESARVQAVTSARDEFYSSNEKFTTIEDMEDYVFVLDDHAYVVKNGEITLNTELTIEEVENTRESISTDNLISNQEITVYMPDESANYKKYSVDLYIQSSYWYGEADFTFLNVYRLTFEQETEGIIMNFYMSAGRNEEKIIAIPYTYFSASATIYAYDDYYSSYRFYNGDDLFVEDIENVAEYNNLYIEIWYQDCGSHLSINHYYSDQVNEILDNRQEECDSITNTTSYTLTVTERDANSKITAMTVSYGAYAQNLTFYDRPLVDIMCGGTSIKSQLQSSSYSNTIQAGSYFDIDLVSTNIILTVTGTASGNETYYYDATSISCSTTGTFNFYINGSETPVVSCENTTYRVPHAVVTINNSSWDGETRSNLSLDSVYYVTVSFEASINYYRIYKITTSNPNSVYTVNAAYPISVNSQYDMSVRLNGSNSIISYNNSGFTAGSQIGYGSNVVDILIDGVSVADSIGDADRYYVEFGTHGQYRSITFVVQG